MARIVTIDLVVIVNMFSNISGRIAFLMRTSTHVDALTECLEI